MHACTPSVYQYLQVFDDDDDTEEIDEVTMATISNDFTSVPPPLATDDSETSVGDNQSATGSTFLSLLVNFAVFLLTMKRVYSLSEACLKSILLLSVILVKIFGTAFKVDPTDLQTFLDVFPKSERSLRNIAGIQIKDQNFKQLICCPKCFKMFNELHTWTIYSHSQPADFLCNHIEYPRHPHASRRKKCAAKLMKQVHTGYSAFLRPLKVYPYRSICRSLTDLLMRPNMLKLCNEWPLRTSKDPSVMMDVYDGQMWKDCLNVNDRPFLSHPNNLALSLNVDWFRPFQHSPYSVGVIYFAVLNLPREIRYLPENILIAGIIPGPSEPSKSMMNHVLKPVVDDLQTLWDGVHMSIPTLQLPVRIRAMLMCISCDIPACRKVCGFLGYNAHFACSKCAMFFPGNVAEGFDFSGYVTASWPCRDPARHKVNAKAVKVALTQTSRKDLESRHGTRYFVLLELPYLNIIRRHVIDPMHNLFLGIAKHVVSVWKEKGVLSSQALVEIQQIVDSVEVPSSVGRIPAKITSGFADFTADQWKNWILIYSLVALKNVIPAADYLCWTAFVNACILLCSQKVTPDTISQAHDLILEFCQGFQEIYGN